MKKKKNNVPAKTPLMQQSERRVFVSSHIALFVIFFWFGAIKLFGLSPANELVNSLLSVTMPGVSFDTFIVFLGLWEVVIGILFLIPRSERYAIILLGLHMLTTFMPLVLLPSVAWQGFLIPTLEGQYIIKNLIIVALAASILVDTKRC